MFKNVISMLTVRTRFIYLSLFTVGKFTTKNRYEKILYVIKNSYVLILTIKC